MCEVNGLYGHVLYLFGCKGGYFPEFGFDHFPCCGWECLHFPVKPGLEVADFVADEFGVLEVCAHFGGDGIGLGDAFGFGLKLADGDGGAAAVEAYGRIVLAIGGFKDLALEGAMAVADAFVLGGAVFPVGEAVRNFLEFCVLSCAVGHGGFVAVYSLGLEAVEAGDALGIEDFMDLFFPCGVAFALGKGFCKAFFAGFGEVVIFDDGAGEAFEFMEGCGVSIAKVELEFFEGWCLRLDPVVDAFGAFAPCLV